MLLVTIQTEIKYVKFAVIIFQDVLNVQIQTLAQNATQHLTLTFLLQFANATVDILWLEIHVKIATLIFQIV